MTDGALTCSADGLVCRVFAPRPWAIWRWVQWLLLPWRMKRTELRAGRRFRLVVEAARAS